MRERTYNVIDNKARLEAGQEVRCDGRDPLNRPSEAGMSMKAKEAGFRIRDSGKEPVPTDVLLPDAGKARRGHKVDGGRRDLMNCWNEA
jgi:hypothetical protein